MARYRIEFKRSVRKDLRKIGKSDVVRILEVIQRLGEDPYSPGSKKLVGEELYRVRVGNFRILYEVIDEVLVVTVIKVSHRKDVYRK